MKLQCEQCGRTLTPDNAHVFKNIARSTIAVYCDAHCVRCDFQRTAMLAGQKQ